MIRIETGRLEIARTRAVRDHGRRIGAGFVDMAAQFEWVDLELGGGGEPGHTFAPVVKVDQSSLPVAFGRERAEDFCVLPRLVIPLVRVRIKILGAILLERRAGYTGHGGHGEATR